MFVRDRRLPISCLSVLLCPAAAFAEPATLRGGAYEVAVKLELPHLEDMTGKTITRICLAAEDGAGNPGFRILSENNPLGKCPISNIHADGKNLNFDIFCEGKNTAKATARFVLAPERFQGRIVMQMGGKNMTMTEVQSGQRVGTCDAGGNPAP